MIGESPSSALITTESSFSARSLVEKFERDREMPAALSPLSDFRTLFSVDARLRVNS